MSSRLQYALIYAPQVREHLRFIERRYYSLIHSVIEEQLKFQPDVETRNRKPLRRPASFDVEWEIRLGPNNRFRVFYQLDQEHRQVNILAIGIKHGNRLMIGGEEVEL